LIFPTDRAPLFLIIQIVSARGSREDRASRFLWSAVDEPRGLKTQPAFAENLTCFVGQVVYLQAAKQSALSPGKLSCAAKILIFGKTCLQPHSLV
jgi:hypothetical protein